MILGCVAMVYLNVLYTITLSKKWRTHKIEAADFVNCPLLDTTRLTQLNVVKPIWLVDNIYRRLSRRSTRSTS